MASNIQEHLKPGDKLNFHNQQASAISIRVEMEDGTEVTATLHPGAEVNVTVGTMNVNAYINDVDAGDGLRVVRDQ